LQVKKLAPLYAEYTKTSGTPLSTDLLKIENGVRIRSMIPEMKAKLSHVDKTLSEILRVDHRKVIMLI